MKLSKKDRLMIANQLLILEKLYPEEAALYTQHREAIEHGYELHYEWLTEHFYDEMSEEECKEVLDILDMYRLITFSYNSLEDKSGIDPDDIRFPGFDGNHEGKQHSYTQYFIVTLGRYDELRGGVEYPDFNSGMPMLEKYRNMLNVWKDVRSTDAPQSLSKEQIIKIIEAS